MNASADEPSHADDESWDEEVLVWNATVARIPLPTSNRTRLETSSQKGGDVRPNQPPRRDTPTVDWQTGLGPP